MSYYKDTEGVTAPHLKLKIALIAAAVVVATALIVSLALFLSRGKKRGDGASVSAVETTQILPVETAAPSAETTDDSFAPEKTGPVTLSFRPGDLDETGGTVSDPGKLHTELFTIPNRVLRFGIADGYRLEVVRFDPAGGAVRTPYTGAALTYAGRSGRWAFVLSRTDGADVTAADAVNVTAELLSTDGGADAGVRRAQVSLAPNADFAACFARSAGEQVSAPVSLAYGGLGISPPAGASYAGFRVVVGRLTDDGIVPVPDAPFGALNAAAAPIRRSLYLPETADAFAFVICTPASAADLVLTLGMPDAAATSRLPGLWYASYTVSGSGADATIKAEHYNVSTMSRDLETYAALLPAGEIRRISCCPAFELIVLTYTVKNGALTKTGTVWRGAAADGASPIGVDVVEAADLGAAEWALILIHRRAEPVVENGALLTRVTGMGGMNQFDAVYAGVRVETISPLTVEEEKDPTLTQNIALMREITIPATGSGLYRTPSSKKTYPFSPFTNVSPWWYDGAMLSNSPLINLSLRTLFTAAKNPNSRFYMQAWGSEPNYICYGFNCAKFIHVLFGFSDLFNADTLDSGPISYFDRYTFSYPADLAALRPGDLLTYYRNDSGGGHVILIQDLVYLGDTLYCVNILESYPPYARQRTLYVGLPAAFSAASGLLSAFPAEDFERYPTRLRVKDGFIRPISDFGELYPDTSVGTVMADRGSDAVYCIGASLLELSVSDAAAKTLTVYRDGALAFTVPLEDAGVKNGLRVVNIASKIREPGLYTVKTDRSGAVQERFYVPDTLPKPTYEYSAEPPGADATVRIRFPDDGRLETVCCYYAWRNPKTGAMVTRPFGYPPILFEGSENGWTTLTVPYMTGGKCFVGAIGLYRTPYGTFWLDEARQSAENEMQFLFERVRRAAYPPA